MGKGCATFFGDGEIGGGEGGTEILHNSHFLSSTLEVMFYLTGSSLGGWGENDKSNPKFNSLCSVRRAHSVLYSP